MGNFLKIILIIFILVSFILNKKKLKGHLKIRPGA
jgi:hypothetical protein